MFLYRVIIAAIFGVLCAIVSMLLQRRTDNKKDDRSLEKIKSAISENHRKWDKETQNIIDTINEIRDSLMPKYHALLSEKIAEPDYDYSNILKRYSAEIYEDVKLKSLCDMEIDVDRVVLLLEDKQIYDNTVGKAYCLILASKVGKKIDIQAVRNVSRINGEFSEWFTSFHKDSIKDACIACKDIVLKKAATNYWFPYFQLKLLPTDFVVDRLIEKHKITTMKYEAIKGEKEKLRRQLLVAKDTLIHYKEYKIRDNADLKAIEKQLNEKWYTFESYIDLI